MHKEIEHEREQAAFLLVSEVSISIRFAFAYRNQASCVRPDSPPARQTSIHSTRYSLRGTRRVRRIRQPGQLGAPDGRMNMGLFSVSIGQSAKQTEANETNGQDSLDSPDP